MPAIFSLTGLLALWLGAVTAVSAGPVFPTPFKAEYSLHSKGFEVAHITRLFRPLPDGTYIYESNSHTVGVLSLFRDDRIVERSHWQPTDSGFQPLHYTYRHTGSKKNRDVKIDFDWKNSKVSMWVNDDHWQMTLEPGTLDKMVYQLAVMRDLQRGLETFHYRIADGGKMKSYNFEAFKQEPVQTPYGDFDNALKVERFRDDRERETIFWCVPQLDYLPVKVVNIEPDGLKTTAVLKQYAALPDSIQSAVTIQDSE